MIDSLKCPNFNTLNDYLKNKFGDGEYSFQINFETMKETIIYTVENH